MLLGNYFGVMVIIFIDYRRFVEWNGLLNWLYKLGRGNGEEMGWVNILRIECRLVDLFVYWILVCIKLTFDKFDDVLRIRVEVWEVDFNLIKDSWG